MGIQKGICRGCGKKQVVFGTRVCLCGKKDPLGTGHKRKARGSLLTRFNRQLHLVQGWFISLAFNCLDSMLLRFSKTYQKQCALQIVNLILEVLHESSEPPPKIYKDNGSRF